MELTLTLTLALITICTLALIFFDSTEIRGSVVSLSFNFPHPPDDSKKKKEIYAAFLQNPCCRSHFIIIIFFYAAFLKNPCCRSHFIIIIFFTGRSPQLLRHIPHVTEGYTCFFALLPVYVSCRVFGKRLGGCWCVVFKCRVHSPTQRTLHADPLTPRRSLDATDVRVLVFRY